MSELSYEQRLKTERIKIAAGCRRKTAEALRKYAGGNLTKGRLAILLGINCYDLLGVLKRLAYDFGRETRRDDVLKIEDVAASDMTAGT